MPNTVVQRHLITKAVLDLLTVGTAKLIGDGVSIAGSTLQPNAFPNGILYSIPGGGPYGSKLRAPDSDAEFVYQVTSVGLTRMQAEWMADRVRLTILARNTDGSFQVPTDDPTGWRIYSRMISDVMGGVDVVGDAPHQIFSVVERFAFMVGPST